MKNVKLMLLAIVAMLLFGMGSIGAQVKSTVIITGYVRSGNYEIAVIAPNYEIQKKKLNNKEDEFIASMKKDMDHWINQGYKLIESSSNSLSSVGERILFILIKEE